MPIYECALLNINYARSAYDVRAYYEWSKLYYIYMFFYTYILRNIIYVNSKFKNQIKEIIVNFIHKFISILDYFDILLLLSIIN